MKAPITDRQAALLRQAEEAVQRATQNKRLIIETIAAGLDVPTGATLTGIDLDAPALEFDDAPTPDTP